MKAGRRAFIPFFIANDLASATKAGYVAELSSESKKALEEIFTRQVPETPDLVSRPVLVIAGRDDWLITLDKRHAQYFSTLVSQVIGAFARWREGADTRASRARLTIATGKKTNERR